MVLAIDEPASVIEKHAFLRCLLGLTGETLIVGIADVRENADVGTDDPFQCRHLPLQRNACLKNTERIARLHLPDTQRNADL